MKMRNYFTDDLQEAIKKGKQYFKNDKEFFIRIVGESQSYYIANENSNNVIKHFKNTAKNGESPTWVEVDLNK